jgi:hypothetical protein
MKNLASLVPLAGLFFSLSIFAAENGMRDMDMPMAPPKSIPAEGASVKIVSPRNGQLLQGDGIPLEFKLTKGSRGNHVHAYVDGELVGMFMSETGTLTGIQPGKHTLELRVVAGDHTTELNASDKVDFLVK